MPTKSKAVKELESRLLRAQQSLNRIRAKERARKDLIAEGYKMSA